MIIKIENIPTDKYVKRVKFDIELADISSVDETDAVSVDRVESDIVDETSTLDPGVKPNINIVAPDFDTVTESFEPTRVHKSIPDEMLNLEI